MRFPWLACLLVIALGCSNSDFAGVAGSKDKDKDKDHGSDGGEDSDGGDAADGGDEGGLDGQDGADGDDSVGADDGKLGYEGSIEEETIETFRKRCSEEELEEKSITVSLASMNTGCKWGQNDNLAASATATPRNGRETTSATFTLPASGKLCDIVISTATQIYHDDEAFLTLGKDEDAAKSFILISDYPFMDRFTKNDDLHEWDWAKIKGLDSKEGVTYCYGAGEGCSFPMQTNNNIAGSMTWTGDDEHVLKLLKAIGSTTDFRLSAVALGNKDSVDCQFRAADNGEVKFDVKYKYVK